MEINSSGSEVQIKRQEYNFSDKLGNEISLSSAKEIAQTQLSPKFIKRKIYRIIYRDNINNNIILYYFKNISNAENINYVTSVCDRPQYRKVDYVLIYGQKWTVSRMKVEGLKFQWTVFSPNVNIYFNFRPSTFDFRDIPSLELVGNWTVHFRVRQMRPLS